MRDIDASEVRRYGIDLRRSTVGLQARVGRLMVEHMGDVAREARAAAPRERPWLSTSAGIQTDHGSVGGTLRASVYSPRDPRGENVGFRVEYGTSDTSPQPFLMPAFARGKERFMADMTRLIADPLR